MIQSRFQSLLGVLCLSVLLLQGADPALRPQPIQPGRSAFSTAAGFTFALTADMREFTGPGVYNTTSFFRGAVEAIQAVGAPAFMITPGDLDPVQNTQWTIQQVLGAGLPWYPIVGNHELPGQGSESSTGANLTWLQGYSPGSVNAGPSGCPTTTYSFDHLNAHFVILNEYCDSSGPGATDGDIPDHLYNWLALDLAGTTQPYIFVAGHEPAFPWPDMDNGRLRHESDSLNQYPTNRDRFWALLKQEGAIYLCGHTHNFSAAQIDGVWQIDTGHARGLGDTGADSSFALISVTDGLVVVEVYRSTPQAPAAYQLRHIIPLGAAHRIYFPTLRK